MSPRVSGWIGLAIVMLAVVAVALAWAGGDARAAKKGLLIAVPLTLVAAVPGLAGRTSWAGRVALGGVALLLTLAAALFVYLVVT